jgi:hypothetical protein
MMIRRPTLFLFVFAVVAMALAAGCQEHATYLYTVEVTTYGPTDKADPPASVDVKWPGGSRTITLPGRRAADTVEITVPLVRHPLGFTVEAVPFTVSVTAAKPDFDIWRATYTGADFVRTPDGALRRIDQVILWPTDAALTPEQRQQLSMALPCGLDVYTEQFFGDFDGDGHPDAVLRRTASAPGSRYGGVRGSAHAGIAEIRHMSFLEGRWTCVFLANHQGVFLNGEPAPGSGPAPYGYLCSSMRGDTQGKDAATAWIYDDLCPSDATGARPADLPARTYVWRKKPPAFEVITFDPANVPGLIERLKDADVSIRMRAARTLAKTKDPRAIMALVAALADNNAYVRLDIVWALEQMAAQKFGQDKPAWETWLKDFGPAPTRP